MSVEIQYQQFTPQEAASLNVLRQQFSPEGTHDMLPEPEVAPQKKVPFAFDLGREYELALEHGDNYKKYFIENAHYYAKESYGKVPVSEYEHTILTKADGRIELALGPDNMSVKESYLVPAKDTTKPSWYRKRSMADVRWVEQMQEQLQNSEEGDTFVDFSPTEFNVSVEERKAWGYGYHSFVRLHKVVSEGGQKKLVSRAIRNYLDAPEQEGLFQKLTGEKVGVSELLGRVERVNPGVSQAYVRVLADKLYETTPEQRRIVPPKEYTENLKSEEEMDNSLRKIDSWLEVVYEMMENGASKDEVLQKFRGWENAVKDYVAGKSTLDEFKKMSVEGMRKAIYSNDESINFYTHRIYEAGTSGCGLGSGFGEMERDKNGMTYDSMTTSTEGNCPEIKCGKCTWKANEEEVSQITQGKLTKCPNCGWKP